MYYFSVSLTFRRMNKMLPALIIGVWVVLPLVLFSSTVDWDHCRLENDLKIIGPRCKILYQLPKLFSKHFGTQNGVFLFTRFPWVYLEIYDTHRVPNGYLVNLGKQEAISDRVDCKNTLSCSVWFSIFSSYHVVLILFVRMWLCNRKIEKNTNYILIKTE